jgi:hypothetical protein
MIDWCVKGMSDTIRHAFEQRRPKEKLVSDDTSNRMRTVLFVGTNTNIRSRPSGIIILGPKANCNSLSFLIDLDAKCKYKPPNAFHDMPNAKTPETQSDTIHIHKLNSDVIPSQSYSWTYNPVVSRTRSLTQPTSQSSTHSPPPPP